MAGEWSRATVDPLVVLKIELSAEHFPTFHALEQFSGQIWQTYHFQTSVALR